MKATAVLAVLALLIAGTASSWDRTFGSELPEQAFFSLVTGDGGILTCGIFIIDVSYSIVSSEGPGGIDCMLVRTDAAGKTLWERDYYSGPWPDLAVAGVPSTDGGFVLAGVTTTMEEGQRNWIFKVDSEGQVIWENNPGTDFDDWTYDMAAVADGGFVLAGYIDSLDGGGPVVSLLRTDGDGREIWNRQYGEYGSGMAEAVMEVDGGDLFVCGYNLPDDAGPAAPFLMRTGPDGGVRWMTGFEGMPGDCYPLDMSMLGDGTVMMAGYGETLRGDYDVWVGSASLDGSALGEWNYGGEMDDMAFSTAPCPGGMVIAGSTDSDPAERNDLLLSAVSPSGRQLWWKTHGGPGNEGAEHIIPLPDGGFLVSGYTSSKGAGDTDIWVLRVDGDGELTGE